MNLRRIRALLYKEWIELRSNRMLVLSAIVLPLSFLANSILTALSLETSSKPAAIVGELPPAYAQFGPRYGAINQMNDMGIMLLMLTPAILPAVIGAFSIVGEKKLKSLEPLLASPLTTGELMMAKAITAAAAPLVAGWASFAVFIGTLATLGRSPVMAEWLLRPAMLVAMVALTPLLALLSTLVAVTASSRTQDPRAAQAWATTLVFPVLGLAMSVLGGVVVDMTVIGIAVGVTAVATAIMYRVSIWLFQREVILTRWK